MSAGASFKYDVAFSFLAQDEPVALAIRDKLEGRFSSFIYSKEQERLAGTDGEIAFGRVFGGEARIVVVLLRDGWGSTPWTRIEETAIRNRAFTGGYDFTLFVQLAVGSQIPPWLPKTTIWMGFERYGIEATAAVIEQRIAQAGGILVVEGPLAKAERLQREQAFQRHRGTFLSSEHGLIEARKHVATSIAAIERLADGLRQLEQPFDIRVSKTPESIAVYAERTSVSLRFQTQYSNSLEGSGLTVKLWKGAVRVDGGLSDAAQLRAWDFDFDVLHSGAYAWHELRGDQRHLSSDALADFAVGVLLDRVNENRKTRSRTPL